MDIAVDPNTSMVTSIVVDTVASTLPVFGALGIALVSFVGLLLKWAVSRSHPGRLLILEQKAEKADTEIGNAIQTVQSHTADIASAVAVTSLVVPGITQQVTTHQAQIAEFQKQIADLTAKITLITSIVPVPTPATPTPTTQSIATTTTGPTATT
jgi:peptidoglycan hydrolase CwlO-like protein